MYGFLFKDAPISWLIYATAHHRILAHNLRLYSFRMIEVFPIAYRSTNGRHLPDQSDAKLYSASSRIYRRTQATENWTEGAFHISITCTYIVGRQLRLAELIGDGCCFCFRIWKMLCIAVERRNRFEYVSWQYLQSISRIYVRSAPVECSLEAHLLVIVDSIGFLCQIDYCEMCLMVGRIVRRLLLARYIRSVE